MSAPVEVLSVKAWNETLRDATVSGATVIDWCGPCKAIAPKYKDLALKTPHVKFLRVDVDRQKAIAQKYQISAMPTFLAIKAGQVVDTLKGADPAGLTRLVNVNAGPNPPVAPLPPAAEAAKAEGNALFKAAKYDEAITKYSEAISLAPTSAVLYANRSMTHLKLSTPSPTLALADADRATELEPKWGKGWVRRGEALVAIEKFEDAADAFGKAAERSEGLVKTEAKQKLAAVKEKLGWH